MLTRITLAIGAIGLIVLLAGPALADATATAKNVSDEFGKACNAGNIAGVMKLYEDDATVIWPGQGEVAKGKADIEKLVKEQCKPSSPKLSFISQDSKAIGKDYIVNVGRWEITAPGPDGKPATMQVRTTEVLHHSAGQWRYTIDHASVGLPPPPPAKTASH